MALGEASALSWSPAAWRRGDRVAVAVLLAIPVVVFVLPALVGHPAISGDNLIQNYPLRVLTGQQLRAGHLPVWNPLSNSGTPLLGGMNAGSAYPGTLVFAVLPALAAWVANLVAVYWAAALGVYALSRWLGMGPLGAGMGAATYAFAGAMVGQLVHVGVVQGQGWLPWIVLCQLVAARAVLGARSGAVRDAVRRALPATLWLAALVGLVCLTGEPRAIVDAEVVVAVVAACELVVHGTSRAATGLGRMLYVGLTALGVLWGVALGLVQLLPGWAFVTLSERSTVSYGFFGAGSYPWSFLSLLVSQGLLGDNGALGTQPYFAWYNLPEVTGYVGLVALTGVAAFVAQLVARRSEAPRRLLASFLALSVVGVVLALGSSTPLGHVLYEVPLLGRTRLQSRSIAVMDLGAAVLFAWWLDAVARRRLDEASLLGRRRLVTAVPATLAFALCAVALVSPSTVTVRLLNTPGSEHLAAGIRTTVAITLVVALAALLAVWLAVRRPAAAATWLTGIALVDLVGFNVFFQSAYTTGLAPRVPTVAAAAATIGTTGRVAIVDPGVKAFMQIARLGTANLNVFTTLSSVQGYGSLISARYADATGTRFFANLDGCAMAHGVFVPLRLDAMAASTNALRVSSLATAAPAGCQPHGTLPWSLRVFGGVARVASVRFEPARGHGFTSATTVRLLDATGRVLRGPAARLARVGAPGRAALVATFATHPLAAGVVVADPAGVRLEATSAHLEGAGVVRLDTALQVGLDVQRWGVTGADRRLTYLRGPAVPATVRLLGGTPSASARIVGRDDAGSLTVAVATAVPATLVRSEAWLPGWEATVTTSRATRTVATSPLGLVQAVHVPAGRSTVTFRYHAPHLVAGALATAAALLGLVAATGALVASRRRGGPAARRRAGRAAGAAR